MDVLEVEILLEVEDVEILELVEDEVEVVVPTDVSLKVRITDKTLATLLVTVAVAL